MKFLAALFALCASAFAAAPDVSGLSAGTVTSGAVSLSASVTTNGSTTKVTFRYGFGGNLDKKQAMSLSDATKVQTAKVNLTSLVGGQTYHFKVEALNADGTTTVDGSDFVVPSYAPTVSLQNTTTPPAGKATLKALITGNGAGTSVNFSYGITSAYGTTVAGTPAVLAADVDKAVTVSIDGLDRGTVYHFRATATSAMGITSSVDTIFVTAANALPVTKADTATLHGRTPILIDVLTNDSDPESDVISLKSVTEGAQGTTEIVGNQILYTPGEGTTWPDTFTYIVEDNYLDANGNGASAVGTVTIFAPGLSAVGLHAALIKDAHGKVVGLLRLMGTEAGSVSGNIDLDGDRFPVTGVLDADGHFHANIPRKDNDPLSLDVSFDQNTSTTLNATIKADGKKYSASATLATLTEERRNELNGRYTLQIPATSGTDTPKGTGFAHIDVKASGSVYMWGKLGDGTFFTARSVLGGAGDAAEIDFWTAPKGARVSGTLQFGADATPTLDGTLNWYRPPHEGEEFFPNGFSTKANASGSYYTPPKNGDHAIGETNKATLILREGNLPAAITQSINLNNKDDVDIVHQGPENLAMKIYRKSGLFRGEFDHPQDSSRRTFHGVLLQQQNIGRGIFSGQNQTGTVEVNLGRAKASTSGGTTDANP